MCLSKARSRVLSAPTGRPKMLSELWSMPARKARIPRSRSRRIRAIRSIYVPIFPIRTALSRNRATLGQRPPGHHKPIRGRPTGIFGNPPLAQRYRASRTATGPNTMIPKSRRPETLLKPCRRFRTRPFPAPHRIRSQCRLPQPSRLRCLSREPPLKPNRCGAPRNHRRGSKPAQ
jgi:hypothetical protein